MIQLKTVTVKICDSCKKEINYSEFCLYHFQKRRDFCSGECFFEFITQYMEVNHANK